jgi:hypothetical protein
MKKTKLELDESVILRLKEMRDLLAGIPLDDFALEQSKGGDGCGGICRFTCSYYCRDDCYDTCRYDCSDTCRGGTEIEFCVLIKWRIPI